MIVSSGCVASAAQRPPKLPHSNSLSTVEEELVAFGSGGGRARPLGVGCIRMEGEWGWVQPESERKLPLDGAL